MQQAEHSEKLWSVHIQEISDIFVCACACVCVCVCVRVYIYVC